MNQINKMDKMFYTQGFSYSIASHDKVILTFFMNYADILNNSVFEGKNIMIDLDMLEKLEESIKDMKKNCKRFQKEVKKTFGGKTIMTTKEWDKLNKDKENKKDESKKDIMFG